MNQTMIAEHCPRPARRRPPPHAGPAAGVGTDISDAAAANIGNAYVEDEHEDEDEAEPPDYATVPAFWSAEITDVTAEA